MEETEVSPFTLSLITTTHTMKAPLSPSIFVVGRRRGRRKKIRKKKGEEERRGRSKHPLLTTDQERKGGVKLLFFLLCSISTLVSACFLEHHPQNGLTGSVWSMESRSFSKHGLRH
jgi:hypothetical protein